jgi:hypothetical protein
LGVTPEQASVTKRIRRVFEFSNTEFEDSLFLTRPEVVVFTHMDYIGIGAEPNVLAGQEAEAMLAGFRVWLEEMEIVDLLEGRRIFFSSKHGQLVPFIWDVNDEPDGDLADDSNRVT